MELYNFRKTEADGYAELACDALSETAREGAFTIWYRFPCNSEEISIVAEPFLVALLVPCMRQKEDIVVRAPISVKLLDSIETFMDIATCWNPELSRILIKTEGAHVLNGNGERVACFFSGGVDSFYSLLKNLEKHPDDEKSITDLIQIRGLDFVLEAKSDRLWESIRNTGKEVARLTGKKVLPVVTNVKVHTNQYTSWGHYPPGNLLGPILHGALLASVGLCLSREFRRIIVPSSYDYAHLFPWGSHPLLDPLWSTETTAFVHDGCESPRLQKVMRQVAPSPVAMQFLRVCWSLEDYNCGKCEKCLRTIMALELAGNLNQCKTFNLNLSLEDFKSLRVSGHQVLIYWEELLREAVRVGRNDLERNIKLCLRTPKTIPRRIKRELERFGRRVTALTKKRPQS